MVARVSPQDTILYANGALCIYLGLTKQELLGAHLEAVAARCQGEIASCFERPHAGRMRNHLVTDLSGRVFESKRYSEGGVLDIVLDEVTSADLIGVELRHSTGTPFDSLNEEELRTARQPERRYLTISHTQLKGVSETSERLAPMELRLMVNSFVEEAGEAILAAGSTLGEMHGDSLVGIYGAPRHYLDHPLRAVRAACDQVARIADLHAGFFREGKEMPACSCGLWTGETLVGTLGNSTWQHYTALGKPVELARRLCELARPGEIVLPEHTLTHLLRVLPSGWEHVRAERDHAPDLSDFRWTGDEIAAVPEHLARVVYLVGPGVSGNPDRAEYFFDYLWSFRAPGREQTIPILRVVRPAAVGQSLELRDDVVSSQAVQTLGKYKLMEVVGVGGMGRVWRGVDRFGNAVAIKVLHGSETVTETQLKRFRREAEVMATLPHRNICRVYEMNEYEGIQFIAMEFVSGLPLYDLLHDQTRAEMSEASHRDLDLPTLIKTLRQEKEAEAQRPKEEGEEPPSRPDVTRVLPFAQTIQILLKVCDAVQFAHEHGVLHRDLKPGNILLREDGEPLVADFGLAKLSASDSHSLSVTGHVVGTFENMSPEQAESSKDVDERADVYSLGTILYQMLTGRRHFEPTGNIVNDAQALRNHEPPRPRTINPQVDSDLEIITMKALRSDPAERYRSVSAFRADLERYRRGEVILAKPVTAFDLIKKLIQRHRAVALVSATSLLIFICGAILAIGILMRQLSNEQRATQDATDQRAAAIEQRAVAEERRKFAEEQEAIAKEAQTYAETQQKLAEEALAEAKRARDYGDEARAKSETDRKLREEAEKLAKSNEVKLEESRRRIEEMQLKQVEAAPVPLPHEDKPSPENEAAQASLREATRIINWELAPMELRRMDRSPEEVYGRVMNAMNGVAQALVLDRRFASAWLFKARLHLALMEYAAAAEAYDKAAAYHEGSLSDADLAAMAETVRACAARPTKALETLSASGLPFGEHALELHRFFADRSPRKTAFATQNLTNRQRTANEIALALMDRNPGLSAPKISLEPGRESVAELRSAGDLTDLSALRAISVTRLAISGADLVDWTTIYLLPLDALSVTDSSLAVLPLPRSFLRLRGLDFSRTRLASLDPLRQMPLLESVSLAHTDVTDLTMLAQTRKLRQLDLSGLDPANLRVLINLPLETLTLSPDRITDRQGLLALRAHRTLKVLRAPQDPPAQRASVFWERFDQGIY